MKMNQATRNAIEYLGAQFSEKKTPLHPETCELREVGMIEAIIGCKMPKALKSFPTRTALAFVVAREIKGLL